MFLMSPLLLGAIEDHECPFSEMDMLLSECCVMYLQLSDLIYIDLKEVDK
jgi:hypothetical protein